MTTVLNVEFNQVAQEVMDVLQVAADGETLSGDMLTRLQNTYNFMIKAWEGQGLHLWSYQEGVLFVQPNQNKYDFSTAKLTNNFFETKLASDELAGASTITVLDASNISDTDNIGIILNDRSMFFTTVSGAPVGNVVTLADVLPGPTTAGFNVVNYDTTPIKAVARILDDVRRYDLRTQYEVPINFEDRTKFFQLPDKVTTGAPVQAYYSRQNTTANDFGIMYLWNNPDTSNWVIRFTYERQAQIITDATDSLDIPAYWYEAIIYNLAKRVMLKYGASPMLAREIKERALETLDQALAFDTAVYDINLEVRL